MTQSLEIKGLNIEHLAAVLELQDKIIANLHEDEKHFILKRSVEDFMKALDSENTHMIGVFDGKKLVAQSIFEFPQEGQPREYEEFAGDVPNHELVVYKAISVDMDYRGRGLMTAMYNFHEKLSRDAGKKVALCQIAADNPASWISALKNGMSIRKVDEDPFDGAKVLYLQKDFYEPEATVDNDGFAMYIGKNIHQEIPALFNKMRYWAAKGYHGVKLDKQTNSIIWARPKSENLRVLANAAISCGEFVLNARDKTIRY